MAEKQGRHAIIEQLLADDITFMFGNPGTVEQGFLDVIKDYPEFKYVLGLQESVAVGMADGYARVTKKPTLVQLHTGVGLGNGIGMLYQAMRGHAPLVVIAGDAGVMYDAMDSQMAADLVGMAVPVTKWSARVTHPSSLLRMLRRAIKIAATPPMGPVFLNLPADVLDAPMTETVARTSIPSTRVAPADDDISQIADWLVNADNPLILMGDGVAVSGGQTELTRVAELLGAPVYGVDQGEVNMSWEHPLYQGTTGHMFGANSARVTQAADAILVVGTYLFPEVFPYLDPAQIFTAGTKLMHIDLDAYEIGKNFPVDLGVVADPKLSLAKLGDALYERTTTNKRALADERIEAASKEKQSAHSAAVQADEAVKDSLPLQTSRFMSELGKHLPSDALIFDEALTSSPPLTRYMPPTQPDSYFQTRGGSLGVGIPGALGLKLAHPDKTVVGFTGDGGSMYTIQALWTAAHYNIGAKFVICNNQSYMLLKLNLMQYWREMGIAPRDFPDSFDLGGPVVNFAQIAESMGVPGVCVDKPEQVEGAIKQMLETDGPFLIDMVVSSELPDPSSGK
jgi:thiamine pyrophosphate-dependent acetolactate synthase large subunit-like protein